MVSESLARALAPTGNVLERRIRLGNDREHQDVVIVGIVGNATQGNARRSAAPVIYRPALQWTRYPVSPTFVVATAGPLAPITVGIRQVLKEAGREYAYNFTMLDDFFQQAPTSERMSAMLASVVAGPRRRAGLHRRPRQQPLIPWLPCAPSEPSLIAFRVGRP